MAVEPSISSNGLFVEWQRATAALRRAEGRGAAHAELVRLSEDVIRTRNSLTEDWLAAGRALPAELIRQLSADELLVHLADDTAHRDL